MAYLERFLSTRYLFTRERRALMTAITAIAILGVAVGVASLVIVIGVMDGAEEELFGKMLRIYPHVKVMDPSGDELMRPEEIVAAAEALPEVAYAEPIVSKQGLFTARLGEEAQLVAGQIVGVTDIANSRVYPIRNTTNGEELTLGEREVVLGAPLAEKLGVGIGERVLVITGLLSQSANRERPSVALRVSGIFETGYHQFDALTAFVSPQTANDAFGASGSADYIDIELKDPFDSAQVAFELQRALGPTYAVMAWENETEGAFFASLKIQKLALFLILMLIVLVAGFNIIGTLILMVIDKTREIGILKAIGSSSGTIRRAFVNAGFLIGALGTGLGVAIGITGCLLLKYVIKFDMPPAVYNFDSLPVVVKPLTVVLIVVTAMAVCLLAAFFPAAQAARLDPVEALRHE